MKSLPNDIFFAEVEHRLSEEGRVMLTVYGNSMRPFMRSGRTCVSLSVCDAESLKCGDVVLFRYRGRHILHRITAVGNGEFELAGDGNYRVSEHCRTSDIVAKVEAVTDRRGRVTYCNSRRWRMKSSLWLRLHPFVRRCILSLLWRIGIK